MKEFIIDKNIDGRSTEKNYPKYFFDDLRKPSKIRLVVGGTKYKEEVMAKESLRELINSMRTAGKVRSVSDQAVDLHHAKIAEQIGKNFDKCPKPCDDHHILALSQVSGCNNILSLDLRMAKCRDLIRNKVGHDCCPAVRVVSTEAAYNDS